MKKTRKPTRQQLRAEKRALLKVLRHDRKRIAMVTGAAGGAAEVR